MADKKLSGYGLTKEIHKSTGSWKPSYGSMYPLLDKLLKEGLVKAEIDGRKKLYSLTREGKRHLPLVEKNKNEFVDNMVATIHAFNRIADPKEIEFILEVMHSVRKGQLPFNELNPEIAEFRATLFELYSRKKDRKKIKSILRNAVKELRKEL